MKRHAATPRHGNNRRVPREARMKRRNYNGMASRPSGEGAGRTSLVTTCEARGLTSQQATQPLRPSFETVPAAVIIAAVGLVGFCEQQRCLWHNSKTLASTTLRSLRKSCFRQPNPRRLSPIDSWTGDSYNRKRQEARRRTRYPPTLVDVAMVYPRR